MQLGREALRRDPWQDPNYSPTRPNPTGLARGQGLAHGNCLSRSTYHGWGEDRHWGLESAEAKKRAMFAGDGEAGDDRRKRNVSDARERYICMHLLDHTQTGSGEAVRRLESCVWYCQDVCIAHLAGRRKSLTGLARKLRRAASSLRRESTRDIII